MPELKARRGRFQCARCGRFIGLDGHIDVIYDGYTGAWEEGYSYCGRCMKLAVYVVGGLFVMPQGESK